jgi:solute carrier family 25 ornithine transporter 2/15
MADVAAYEIHELETADHKPSKSARRQFLDALIDFTGGIMGGTASVYVGQPLDTVKVKMQTFPALHTNAWRCFMTTLRQEGIAHGLYAGTVPSLAAQVAENSVLFMAYGLCQKVVATATDAPNIASLSAFQNASAGFFAAFFSSLVLCPTELVKCKLQAMREMSAGKQTAHRIGPWSLTRQILREEGPRGMFRGLVPTFAREMPGYFFFFGGYELSRMLLTPPGKTKDEIGAVRTMICGGLGGISLWVAIFPFDVIKSRVQIQTVDSPKNPSFVRMLILIGRNEGIRALYKGLGPTVLRTFPATGALFLAVETTRKVLGDFADYYGVD